LNTDLKGVVEFTVIYNRYKTRVYNYVLKMTSDIMTAEDIVQNVFLKFYENMNTLKSPDSSKYWIYTTARNEIFAYFRGRKTKKDQFNVEDTEGLEKPGEADTEHLYDLKEFKELIEKELETMEYEYREIFLLREYGGLSYREIGSVLNTNEALVKSRLFSIRKKLIKKLSYQIK
jgi:RNA polymerase sigma-70 factor (ECF subfamily)